MYTLWALTAAAAAVVLELVWARTGILRRRAYWITIAITWAFQVPVDGWLTKLSAPIVIYNGREFGGLRFPWDIPLEDFAYGFALVTLTLCLWVRAGHHSVAAGRGGSGLPTCGPADAAPDDAPPLDLQSDINRPRRTIHP